MWLAGVFAGASSRTLLDNMTNRTEEELSSVPKQGIPATPQPLTVCPFAFDSMQQCILTRGTMCIFALGLSTGKRVNASRQCSASLSMLYDCKAPCEEAFIVDADKA